jgi:hypothetical protein
MKKLLLLIAVATLCFAATESKVSRASVLAVERSIRERLAAPSQDPYDLMEESPRGTYLDGYGVLFTTELDLVNAGVLNLTPFKPTVSKEEIAGVRDRKVKKIAALRETMRNLILNASTTLEGLPPNEHVAMEARLFYFSWEDSKGLPRRLFMSAEKQKLLDAKAAHAGPAELAAIIEEQER